MSDGTGASRFDAIVVGSGAAGSIAAMELTEGGMRVLLLEAGRSIDPRRDFPPPTAGPGKPSPWLDRLRGQAIQSQGPGFRPSLRHFYVSDRDHPYHTPAQAPFLWLRGRQVGGRLHTWARAVLRMSDHELDGASEGRPAAARWPISYRDLAPYYDRVERTLGVLGDRDGLPELPDGRYVGRPPVSASSQLFGRWIEDHTGLRVIRNRVVAHDFDRVPLPLRRAAATGRLELRSDAVVGGVLVDDAGRAVGVSIHHRRTRRREPVFAPVIVLCASAFETVRLLLASRCEAFPGGLGSSGGHLGRYAGDHVMLGMQGSTSDDFVASLRAAGLLAPPPVRAAHDQGSYCMYVPGVCGRFGAAPQFAGRYGIQCGATARRWWMLAFGEMLPCFDNQISLHPRRRDPWGVPIAHIDVRHRDNEERMLAHMAASMAEIVDRLGFGRERPDARLGRRRSGWPGRGRAAVQRADGAFVPGASVHETGGARMGRCASDSVVDPWCRTWDAPNVFVTDGACLPSSGHQNHTLTIMAVTARACDFILRSR